MGKLTKAQRVLLERYAAPRDLYATIISGSDIRPALALWNKGLITISTAYAPMWSRGSAEVTDAGRAALAQQGAET